MTPQKTFVIPCVVMSFDLEGLGLVEGIAGSHLVFLQIAPRKKG